MILPKSLRSQTLGVFWTRQVCSMREQSSLKLVSYPRGATLRSIWALLLRETATNSAYSVGGVAWAFVRPMAAILLLTVIFSAGFQHPPVGDVFAIFYATGMVPFTMFASVSNAVGWAIVHNGPLLQYPRIAVLDTIIATLVFTVVVQSVVALCLYVLVLNLWETKTVLMLGPVMMSSVLAM